MWIGSFSHAQNLVFLDRYSRMWLNCVKLDEIGDEDEQMGVCMRSYQLFRGRFTYIRST